VANGYQLWSETFERDLKDILAVQTDVAERVVKALKVNLQPAEQMGGAGGGHRAGEVAWLSDSARMEFSESEHGEALRRSRQQADKPAGGANSDYKLQRITALPAAALSPGKSASTDAQKKDAAKGGSGSGLAGLMKQLESPNNCRKNESAKDAEKLFNRPVAAVNPEAYQCFLQGRHAANATNSAEREQAAKYFRLALKKDPTYAPAYCSLAESAANPEERKNFAQKALDLNPALAEAHLTMGTVQGFNDWNLAAGEKELRAALALNPNLAPAHARLGWLLSVQGRTNEALLYAKKGFELDPCSPSVNQLLAETYYYARQNDKAIAQAKEALKLDPEYAPAQATLGWAYLKAGKPSLAQTTFAKTAEQDQSGSAFSSARDSMILAESKKMADADQAQQAGAGEKTILPPKESAPMLLAADRLAQNDKEQVLNLLEKACAAKDPACLQLKVNPAFDGLRNEPRFQALVKKIGLDK
jgi:tetratricopeptide (TPR) repeat protein